MKKIIRIMIIAALFCAAVSCKKAPETSTAIVAEWHLVEMTGAGTSALPEVYIDFKADYSFEIYQKVGEGRFRRYDGTYAVAEDIVTGEYSDGEDWGCSYTASFEADGEVLAMTADEKGRGEVCRYEKASLDQKEKDEADVVTKADDSVVRFF